MPGEKDEQGPAAQQDRINDFIEPAQLPFLRKVLSNDELWAVAAMREVKEHGFGSVTLQVNEGEVGLMDTVLRRRDTSRLALSM